MQERRDIQFFGTYYALDNLCRRRSCNEGKVVFGLYRRQAKSSRARGNNGIDKQSLAHINLTATYDNLSGSIAREFAEFARIAKSNLRRVQFSRENYLIRRLILRRRIPIVYVVKIAGSLGYPSVGIRLIAKRGGKCTFQLHNYLIII